MAIASFAAPAHAPAAAVGTPPAPEPQSFSGTGLPSLDPDDGKFFGVAGEDLQTLADVTIVLYVGVPAGTSTFTIGIFDGELGGRWDDLDAAFSYRLYRDPLKNGTTAMLVDTIASTQTLDDDWYEKTYSTDNDAKAPSGNYFYRLEAGWTSTTPERAFNNFKVRTSGQISVRAGQDFGFAGGPQNGGDPGVGAGDPHPGEQNDPNANSYDGQFVYFFYVPTELASITFWDGDNDRSGDTDDPNTPNTDPDGSGPAQAEGANQGAPADDTPTARHLVPPSIFYTVQDPEDHLFTNTNPSGNTEWERFIVGDSASDPDVMVTYELQAGLWRYRAQGMDAHNLNVLRSTYEIYSTGDLPLTVNPPPSVVPDRELRTRDDTVIYYAHTVKNNGASLDDFNLGAVSEHGWATAVYADTDGDGILDPGEPKITQTGPMGPGQELDVLVELSIPDLGSGVTDLLRVTASSRSEWALQGTAVDTTRLNQPPVAILSSPASVPEGTPVTLDATGSSDPDGDPIEYRWDFEGDGVWDLDWGPSATVTHTWGDDVTVSPVVEVRDGEFTSSAAATIAIVNVAPSASITIDPALSEGIVYSLDIHVTDPGSDDLRVAVDFGDGSSSTTEFCDSTCPDADPSPDVHPADFVHSLVSEYGDNGLFAIRITITDDDEGFWEAQYDADVQNLIPSISLREAESYAVDEGLGIALEATATDAGSDDLTFTWDFGDGTVATRVFYNDGVGPDPPMSPGGPHPFVAIDAASHVYGDDGRFLASLTVTDDDGGSVRIERSVDVRNVAPSIDAVDVYSQASFRLRVAGEKWHDVRVSVIGEDRELASAGVTRYPGSPDEQSATIPMTRLSLLSPFRVVVYYTPEDDPVNGQPNGANPVWVTVIRPDGQELRLEHTFNVQHPATWEWEPGTIRTFIATGGAVAVVTGSDPGSDDLTFRIEFGDGGSSEEIVFNNGVSADPDPSTDVNPIVATVRVSHEYAPGTYTVVITVSDDDGGIATVTLVVTV